MKIVKDTYEASQEIKKSIFLSFLTPFEVFHELNQKLKLKHPKAVHIVWAYRHLNEFNQIVENSSDDGEPKGTSGPPILNVMRGVELVNSAILVVRYFGGIKLGTGGLVRAYGSSAKIVIDESKLYEYEFKEKLSFLSDYNLVGKIEYFLNKESISLNNRVFNSLNVLWEVSVTNIQKEEILDFLNEYIQTGHASIIAWENSRYL